MISVITIVLFFIYLLGLGYTLSTLIKKPENRLEIIILYLGLGLGVFPILTIIMNTLKIPLDWKIILLLSVIFPIYKLIKNIFKKDFKLSGYLNPQLKFTKNTIYISVAILISLISLYIYAKGAFAYPYLEDTDPWGHSVGVKYVALEKTAFDPSLNTDDLIDPVNSYMDPYPPAYDILLGVLHQTSPDLTWTMKFFNALIISLGFVFFYLFSKEFMGNRKKALFATFILAAIPSYLSHFIWAHSLVITLIFPTFYAYLKIQEDKRWWIIAAILTASIWVSQNLSQPIKITTMILIFLVVGSITHKRILKREFLALFSGLVLSFFWWGAMIKKYGFKTFLSYYSGSKNIMGTGSEAGEKVIYSIFNKIISLIKSLTSSGGTGSRPYTFNDFFVAQHNNMINNPIGVGVVLSMVTLFAVVWILIKYKSTVVTKRNTWLCISLFWLIFTFWGVNGENFPISVARGSFRVWMLMAIPISLIATEGSFEIAKIGSKFKIPKWIVFGLIIFGVLLTSGYQKYSVNTAMWPTHGSILASPGPFEYAKIFDQIPMNKGTFIYAGDDKAGIGFGKNSCAWCQELIDFRGEILYKSSDELYTFLKNNEYEYLIINPERDFKIFSGKFGENETQKLLPQRYQEIQDSSDKFTPIAQSGTLTLIQIN